MKIDNRRLNTDDLLNVEMFRMLNSLAQINMKMYVKIFFRQIYVFPGTEILFGIRFFYAQFSHRVYILKNGGNFIYKKILFFICLK